MTCRLAHRKPLRVLHLSAGNLYGGIETFLVTLARCQRASMDSVFGLCFDAQVARELRLAGAEVRQLGSTRLSRPWTVRQARQTLVDLLSREGFDVVICHGTWPLTVFGGTVSKSGVPLAYWAHSPPMRHFLDRLAARANPQLVITNSRFTLGEHRAVFPDSSKVVLRYPVLPNAVDDRLVARRALRRELRTPDEDVVIVCSSRLEPWKGHRLLLGALAGMQKVGGWTAWIAGGAQRKQESEYLADLTKQAVDSGLSSRVRFVGQRTDVPSILAASDIHCQPNTGPEPFGIAFIEALYAGLPVVTSNLGAASEIVTSACGLLVAADVGPLTEALSRLVQSEETRMELAAGGPSRAAEMCGPETTMAAIERELSVFSERSEGLEA